MSNIPTYVVAGSKSWNREVFETRIRFLPGLWHFIGSKEELTLSAIDAWQPDYLFFLHWSWKVPEKVVAERECVCFHMTDVPFGRGGSPLQNLILRGYRSTQLTALRMTEEFDAGPVYLKEPLSLDGTAQEILVRSSYLAANIIERIIRDRPTPQAQSGEAVTFKRRQPHESEIPELPSVQALHDFIRMLDGEGYPRAFVRHRGFRYEFSHALIEQGTLKANVEVMSIKEGER